jgi:hypothetical protein
VRHRCGGAEGADVELAGNDGVEAVGGVLELDQFDLQPFPGEQALLLGNKELGVAGDRQIADLERFGRGVAEPVARARAGSRQRRVFKWIIAFS